MLSDPTRLDILELLARGPRNVTAISRSSKQSKQVTSYHLSRLRRGPLVATERQGKSIVYKLNKAAVKTLAGALARLTLK